MKRGLTRIVVAFFLSCVFHISGESASPEAPPQAAAVGYTVNTFSGPFDATTVDMNDTGRSKFRWYPYRLWGARPHMNKIHLNGDGGITLEGHTSWRNAQIATARPAKNRHGFVGTAFGGGGYFEASFRFNPDDVVKSQFEGWPAWWSIPIENVAYLKGRFWPNQEDGYLHLIEADFFEYHLGDLISKGKRHVYGGGLHDWYGIQYVTCPKGLCDVNTGYSANHRWVPPGTDFNEDHRYGFLWVPATEESLGYAEWYFDGIKIGERNEWEKYNGQSPPPRSPWLFSWLDTLHMILILGTGVGQPMTVSSVNVWQVDASQNLSVVTRK